jgi:hypothetical protein
MGWMQGQANSLEKAQKAHNDKTFCTAKCQYHSSSRGFSKNGTTSTQ